MKSTRRIVFLTSTPPRAINPITATNESELPPDVDSLTPEQVSVNYIEQSDNGVTIRQLMISPDGDSLGDWPKGFFEERSGELF